MKNAVVLMVVVALAVAACGDSSSDEEGAVAGAATEGDASPTASSDGTPVPKGSTTAPPASSAAPETTTTGADLPEPVGGTEGTEVPAPPAAEMTEMDTLIAMAKADLAARLGIPADQISLREAREVTWPDTSLGCPEPGMAYSQVLTPGLLIRLSAGGEMYSYHSGGDRDPFLCEQTSEVFDGAPPKEDEFVPPPGSETD